VEVTGIAESRSYDDVVAAHAPTYRQNRLLAAAESERVLASLPMPADASPLPGRPDGWPNVAMSLGPSDGTLTRTAWWSVPTDGAAVESYLTSHVPARMEQSEWVGGGPDGIRTVSYVPDRPTNPETYNGVELLVQWLEIDGRTVLRADTFTPAREVRDPATYVDDEVDAVDVDRVVADPPDNRQAAPVRLTRPANADAIDLLVTSVNALPASTRPAPTGFCPMPGDPPPSVMLTFHTSDGVVRMHRATTCHGQVRVTRDGRPLEPTLDPGDLATVVEEIVRDR
jgi:hypothetical protein